MVTWGPGWSILHISIISNYTFCSSLPGDLKALHSYGSESMSSVLADALSREHEVDFYAPVGSSRIGRFHPLRRTDGKYLPSDLLDDISLDGSKYTDLLNSDFLIDMTPWSNNTEQLALYHDYYKYLNYRLGYMDYKFPANLDPQLKHHITHCKAFADLYEKAGYPGCQVARFGISDFWCPRKEVQLHPLPSQTYTWYFYEKYGITPGYYLFPHRYNKEKGSFLVLKLAQDFPKETFVFSSAAVLPDHIAQLNELKQEVAGKSLTNVKFVDFPSTPDREYYRRELYRNAKATLSPFINNVGYHDTGGLLSQESIKCGTPVICTRSPGSEEILGHQEDTGCYFIDGYESLKLNLKYVDFLSAKPAPWKWTTDLYVLEYEEAIKNIIG